MSPATCSLLLPTGSQRGSVAAYDRHTGDTMTALHLRPITPPLETNTPVGKRHTSHIDTNNRNSPVDLNINSTTVNH